MSTNSLRIVRRGFLLLAALVLYLSTVTSLAQPDSAACKGLKDQVASLREQVQVAQQNLSSDLCAGPARFECEQRVKQIQEQLTASNAAATKVCNPNYKPPPPAPPPPPLPPPPPVQGWFDALTGKPAPYPAPYDLVTRSFDPDNGLPSNPALGSQTHGAQADPSLCGIQNPSQQQWQPCTNQPIQQDTSLLCPVGTTPGLAWPLSGHDNWTPAIYEGTVTWGNHSYYLQDDDYSFALIPYDLAGLTLPGVTKQDVDGGDYLHSEFDSRETINQFSSWYWDMLHDAVDADTPVGNGFFGCSGAFGATGGILSHTCVPPYPKTHAIFDRDAIVMGLYGLDCAHGCGAEIHPVYAFALHYKDDPNDDTWAIFVRNWGDEGYCSSSEHLMYSGQPLTFFFRFKRPGGIDVKVIDEPSRLLKNL